MSAHRPQLKAYRARRVLVLGASGFIGSWAARRLAELQAQLFFAGRDLEALAAVCETHEFRATLHQADFSRPGALSDLFRQAQPHITFNLAGYGVDPTERDPDLAAALNTRLVAEIAAAVAASPASSWRGAQIVHAGSAAEYGPVAEAVSENSPCHPVSLYGRTKLAGTQELLAAQHTGLRAVVARLFTVYGPGEHPGRLLPSLLAATQSGQPLQLTAGLQRRDFTYVGDVAEGLVRLGCLESSGPLLVNLATSTLTSVREFAESAADVLGMKKSQLQFAALPLRSDEAQQGPADITRLQQLLGWRPAVSIRKGIRLTQAFATHLQGVKA